MNSSVTVIIDEGGEIYYRVIIRTSIILLLILYLVEVNCLQ